MSSEAGGHAQPVAKTYLVGKNNRLTQMLAKQPIQILSQSVVAPKVNVRKALAEVPSVKSGESDDEEFGKEAYVHKALRYCLYCYIGKLWVFGWK